MEPLNPYEIAELLKKMDEGAFPVPVGSLWATPDSDQLFMVLHHANMPMEGGIAQCVVLQTLPDGSAWIQRTDHFMSGTWQNVGFVWDRNAHV